MSEQKYVVLGKVSFPLRFKIKATSMENAMNYAKKVLNNVDVLKAEIEVSTRTNKEHLIICDEFNFNWTEVEEE